MISHLEIRRLAALLFNCTPHVVRVEHSVEEVDGQAFDVAEAYCSSRPGRVVRGQRDAERVARVPYTSPFYDGRVQREPGHMRAMDALAELISGELAQRGAA